ncbi:protein C2-DOMAIN ABA-RELATED 2-like isoform X2 [Neltuma alba]|uniref:protein C2-DOMAIN ABA-RELATED 2-like isoform X2 n=1 Tax=Neltuma alba TaxID=207710 RepID=UPI0010A4064E|nr:protein C2-DOMAIN ABA-RELATED 2-like isoform X2 [Prosopis alba]
MDRVIVRVKRGLNLAIRDAESSDPYVLIKMANQKLETRVVERNINPEWNEDLALSISDPHLPVQLFVYDKDKFFDDKMGEAEFDINPFLEVAKKRLELEGLQDGTIITKIEPNRQNCLAEESQIVWKDGKVVQNMFLRLKNVESGEVELQLSMENMLGLLRIRVQRGINLAIRDTFSRSSDPCVVFQMGKQFVYDRDIFSFDDKMGEAEFDINPIVEAVKMGLEGLPDGTTIRTILPNRQNRLVERSQIVWKDGQVVQNMALRLKDVECGEVELQLRWIKLPTPSGL